MNTRGNNKSVVVPKVESENGKKTFYVPKCESLKHDTNRNAGQSITTKSKYRDTDFDF